MKPDNTSWKRMRFKNNKVWMSTGPDGKPVVQNGKVLIKYQLEQEHEYWVHAQNVTALDDGSQPARKTAQKRPAGSKKGGVKGKNKPAPEADYEDAICIYTDGASSGNPGPAGIGILLRYGNHEREISRHIGTATNNIAELEAIRVGLAEVKNRNLPVRIFTDSSYAVGVLTMGWKAQKNQEIINAIQAVLPQFKDLKFIKIKGHAGHEGNEKADMLATSAASDPFKK